MLNVSTWHVGRKHQNWNLVTDLPVSILSSWMMCIHGNGSARWDGSQHICGRISPNAEEWVQSSCTSPDMVPSGCSTHFSASTPTARRESTRLCRTLLVFFLYQQLVSFLQWCCSVWQRALSHAMSLQEHLLHMQALDQRAQETNMENWLNPHCYPRCDRNYGYPVWLMNTIRMMSTEVLKDVICLLTYVHRCFCVYETLLFAAIS